MKQRKVLNKIRKAVYLVDQSVNSEFKNMEYARSKAASYNYWLHKIGKFALVNGKLI